uniref:PepSY domain-containing protein n=1 Tax=Candidatus Nitrotoga fabula TaxID=2182327 RepID=A0A2X0QWP0_9PROT|nr:conserved exported protein of unknown function [Candidatus Nitrotoga fabula]
MKKQHNIIRTALFTMAMTAVIAANAMQPSGLKEKEAKELQLFSLAKISLSEAIKAAEQKIGGKAIEAELDDESETVQFEVEVLKDGKIHKVMVDGETGHVLKVSLDDESSEGNKNEKE